MLQFGVKQQEDIRKIDWLWRCKGKLLIISTEFIKGVHFATRPEHYLEIVNHLYAMHKAGFVHGDIRAFNMVLNYENDKKCIGKLIDFDYGGKLSTFPKYPSGYALSLDDGLRLGSSGAEITASHDWYALGYIIFDLYELVHEDYDADDIIVRRRLLTPNEQIIRDQKAHLTDMRNHFTTKCGNYSTLSKPPHEFLKEYLELANANNFLLALTEKFRKSLSDCKMLGNNARINSKGATGSPPKIK